MNSLIGNLKKRLVRRYYRFLTLKNLRTEIQPCVICGNTTDFQVVSSRDRYGLPIKTQKCKHCGLVFIQPMPTADFVSRFYSTGMYRGLYKGVLGASDEFVKLDRSLERAEERIAFIESNTKLARQSRILDLGCSEGTLLKELKRKNPEYKVYGIEPGVNFSKFNKENIDGLYESIDQVPQEMQFDLVTAWHVLEHLRNPVETLGELRKVMKVGALIVVEVPYFDEHRNTPKSFHVGHIYHYNEESISNILEKAGFSTGGICRTVIGDMRIIAVKQ